MAEYKLERHLLAGIRAAKKGESERAQQHLKTILRQEAGTELAWIWLAYAVSDKRERRFCLEKVMKLNPRNTYAEEAYNLAFGILGESQPIQWDEMSAAARTRIESESVREAVNKLFDIEPPPVKPQVRIVRGLISATTFVLLLMVFVPALRPWNLIDALIPDDGNADVVFVRAIPMALEPVTTAMEAEAPVQEFVLGSGTVPDTLQPEEPEQQAAAPYARYAVYDFGTPQAPPPPSETRWLLEVTIEHVGTDERGFVNGWDVILPDGRILRDDQQQQFTRSIPYPNMNPQFTTSRFVWLPAGTPYVTIRAHDTDGGYGGREVRVDFNVQQAAGYEVLLNQ